MEIKPQKIEMMDVKELIPYLRNPKDHPPEQVVRLTFLIRKYGFKGAILIDKNNEIVAGHYRLLAAKNLGVKKVPVIIDREMTPEQARAFRIADNKVAESEWLEDLLAEESLELMELGFSPEDIALTEEETNKILSDYENTMEQLRANKIIEKPKTKVKNKKSAENETKEKLAEEKIKIKPYKQSHILLSFHPDLFAELAVHIREIVKIKGIEYEQSSN